MNQEIVFAKTLEKVRRLAKEQGNCVSEEQVRSEFAGLDLKESQLEMVFDYLRKHNVGIGEPVDQDAFLTDEERDYLQMYLDEIEALPVYTDGQRQVFCLSVMAGDKAARQLLTESFLREVADIARLYAGQGVALEDLIGEGNVAAASAVTMLDCVEGIDEVEGFIVRMIMDAMEELINEDSQNRQFDENVLDRVNDVNDKAKELYDNLLRKVTVQEVAQELGISEEAVREAMEFAANRIEYMVL